MPQKTTRVRIILIADNYSLKIDLKKRRHCLSQLFFLMQNFSTDISLHGLFERLRQKICMSIAVSVITQQLQFRRYF